MDLNITLLKTTVESFEQIIPASKRDEGDGAFVDRTILDVEGFDFPYRMYIQSKPGTVPKWVNNYGSLIQDVDAIENVSHSGLFLFQIPFKGHQRFFAVSQGFGYHGINDALIERNFGLKTTLSTVDAGRLKHIDAREMVVSSKQKMVTTNAAASLYELEDSVDEDLLKKVTGHPKPAYAEVGKYLGGYDNLVIKGRKKDLKDIAGLAKTLLERFESNDYKENFDFIDRIAVENDPETLAVLNANLTDALNARIDDGSLLIAFPNQYEWEGCIRYSVRGIRPGRSIPVDVLTLSSLYDILPSPEEEIDLLNAVEISGFDDERPKTKATKLNRLLHFQTRIESQEYFLSDGQWYRLSSDYFQELLGKAQRIEPLPDGALPAMVDGEAEKDYNERVADSEGFRNCDRNLHYFPGNKGKVEFCDLYDDRNVHSLICVKKYGYSASLSHLFAQARVAADLLIKDEPCRNHFLEMVGGVGGEWQPRDKKFVFAIAKKGDGNLVESLPIFALLDLVRTWEILRGLGYQTAIARIPITNPVS